MALKHFLLTIPLGCLLTTGIVMYLVPAFKPDMTWYELYFMLVLLNVAVTILAYLLMPPGRRHAWRRASRIFSPEIPAGWYV